MKNPVKEKLARGELVASMTVRLVSGIEIVPIAKSAGFDSLYIDLEHSSLTLQAASQISIMALEAGIPALVRVPANTPEYISRVLDGGALGVIAPGVRSAEEAHAVVAAARYPPAGARGLVAGLPHFGFRSVAAAEALPALNQATLVMVQCESAASLDATEEIVAIEGIDAYRISLEPRFADTVPLARALIDAAPERVIWGSDYPHLSFSDRVDSRRLFTLLEAWVPDKRARDRILVENPLGCFGF